MAVYTKLESKDFEKILQNNKIGKIEKYSPITEGIENTNYLILVDGINYILTIYEKRVNESDLPFFTQLMQDLNKNNFKCPKPIVNNSGVSISKYNNKSLMISSFLEGKPKKNLNPAECKQVGAEAAKLHLLTSKFKNISRANDLSISSWKKIFDQVKDQCSKIHKDLPKLISQNLTDVEKNWPKNLPSGIIHADLFPDNIFFKDKNGDLHTPIPDSFLDGITRRTVIDIAKLKNIKVNERKILPDELGNFEGCFLTGTAAEVTPVSQIQDFNFKVCNTIIDLSESYQSLVRKKVAA